MKTEKEILEEIEKVKLLRDIYVVSTKEWEIFNWSIKYLKWVLEK